MYKRSSARRSVRRFFQIFAIAIAAQLTITSSPALADDLIEYDHIRTELHGDTGPVVVLIPGMSTPAEVWDETVKTLSPAHRLLTVEIRGFDGKRGTLNERAGVVDGVLSDLASDLENRQIVADALVGHSFGGVLALKFGLDHPKLAKQLMILDALPYAGIEISDDATVDSVTPRAERIRATMAAQADAIRAAGAAGVQSVPANQMSISSAHATTITNWSMTSEPLVTAQAVYELLTTDLRDQISAISMPVTVLYVAHETPVEATEKFTSNYSAIPHIKLIPVGQTAHFIMLDRPDIFQAELRKLLGEAQ